MPRLAHHSLPIRLKTPYRPPRSRTRLASSEKPFPSVPERDQCTLGRCFCSPGVVAAGKGSTGTGSLFPTCVRFTAPSHSPGAYAGEEKCLQKDWGEERPGCLGAEERREGRRRGRKRLGIKTELGRPIESLKTQTASHPPERGLLWLS